MVNEQKLLAREIRKHLLLHPTPCFGLDRRDIHTYSASLLREKIGIKEGRICRVTLMTAFCNIEF